jgi:hypothetical protein
MAHKMPRVPEASRSPKGRPPVVKQDTRKKAEPENPENPDQQGQTANIRQNTQNRQKNR